MANLPKKFLESERLKRKSEIYYLKNSIRRLREKERKSEDDNDRLTELEKKLKDKQLKHGRITLEEMDWRNQRLHELEKEINQKGGLEQVAAHIVKEKDENERILRELDTDFKDLPIYIREELAEPLENKNSANPASPSRREYGRTALLGVSLVSLLAFLGLSIQPFTCTFPPIFTQESGNAGKIDFLGTVNPISTQESGNTNHLITQEHQLLQISGWYPVWMDIGSTDTLSISIKPESDTTKRDQVSKRDTFPDPFEELPETLQTDSFQKYILISESMYIIRFMDDNHMRESDETITVLSPRTWEKTIKPSSGGCKTIEVIIFEEGKKSIWTGVFNIFVVSEGWTNFWLATAGITIIGGTVELVNRQKTSSPRQES